MARLIDGDKIVEALSLIAKCWSVSPFVSKEKHLGAVSMLREVEREVKEAPTLTQPNEPLTLEELRQMDGEPVFLETGEVTIHEQLIAEWEILTEHDDSCFYFTRRKRGFHIKDYGKTWIAYRRPPEGEEETKT